MTHPMTGQPATEDERTEATQKANAELSKMLESGEITKGFDDGEEEEEEEESGEKTNDEKLAELREAKENGLFDGVEEIVEENEQATTDEYDMVRNKNDDSETELVVTDGDTEQTFTREEWDARRDTRMRTWKRMARDGTMFVRVARWFNDADVNKVQTGRGFYGYKTGETDKAFKFEVSADDGNHNAETEMVWVPKKAVKVYELR